MSIVKARQAISLDGFTAGPHQSLADPFGLGGMRLTEWMFAGNGETLADRPEPIAAAIGGAGVGAYVMGRNMFGPGRGEWDLSWTGWWGEDPPNHAPVYVLTHHPRESLPMQGGTTFHFVTEGIESALAQAQKAAGDSDVQIDGGASTIRQYLAAGLLDELYLHVVPITLGAGERLLDGLGELTFEPVDVIAEPTVTHVRYHVSHREIDRVE